MTLPIYCFFSTKKIIEDLICSNTQISILQLPSSIFHCKDIKFHHCFRISGPSGPSPNSRTSNRTKLPKSLKVRRPMVQSFFPKSFPRMVKDMVVIFHFFPKPLRHLFETYFILPLFIFYCRVEGISRFVLDCSTVLQLHPDSQHWWWNVPKIRRWKHTAEVGLEVCWAIMSQVRVILIQNWLQVVSEVSSAGQCQSWLQQMQEILDYFKWRCCEYLMT